PIKSGEKRFRQPLGIDPDFRVGERERVNEVDGTVLQDGVSDSQVPPHVWVKDGMSSCENNDQTEGSNQSRHPLRQRNHLFLQG
ncbi:MAG: hypothetical protein YYHSYBAR_000966, partial [Candidatus Fervidibacter sacchari]